MTVATWAPREVDSGLAAWTSAFLATADVAAQLALTPFVPKSLRVMVRGQVDGPATAAVITAAILTGMELGLEPMASLRSIDVIDGAPALRAVALRALVQRAGHDLWVEEATSHAATVAGKRAGSEHVQRITWTMDDARARGLAGKPNWRSQPRNMLVARASGDVARLIASDALLGLPYTVEELQDGADTLSEPVSPAAADTAPAPTPRKRTQRRARAMTTVDLPAELPPPPPLDEPPLDEPEIDRISVAQQRAMHSAFNRLRVTDRADRLAMTSQLIGRDVASATEMTSAEAGALLDALADMRPEETDDVIPEEE